MRMHRASGRTSSRIENYLGFPTGISGMALAGRAGAIAEVRANVSVACHATRLRCDRRPYRWNSRTAAPCKPALSSSRRERIIASWPIADLPKFIGAGFITPHPISSETVRSEEIVVVGGGNSAGQAAVFLAGAAATFISWSARAAWPTACRAI